MIIIEILEIKTASRERAEFARRLAHCVALYVRDGLDNDFCNQLGRYIEGDSWPSDTIKSLDKTRLENVYENAESFRTFGEDLEDSSYFSDSIAGLLLCDIEQLIESRAPLGITLNGGSSNLPYSGMSGAEFAGYLQKNSGVSLPIKTEYGRFSVTVQELLNFKIPNV